MARSVHDWQQGTKEIKERGSYLLEKGIWSDCRFLVGVEPNQQTIEGHKLILAMASPVFEAMFYGGMAENNPISILDVTPDAFKALLEYIYSDKINLTSFDHACELCYVAKKYMLPYLVEECTKYLWSDLNHKNACRAYEFAKLFEEPVLMEKCLEIICNNTQEVLNDPGFEELELTTVLTIFAQEKLSVSSELDLFKSLSRIATTRSQNDVKVQRPENPNAGVPPTRYPTIRDVLRKIRFLTLTPQQFAEGPATSELLTQAEKFAILMNISSPATNTPMPEGFSTSKETRRLNPFWIPGEGTICYHPGQSAASERFESIRKYYCSRQIHHISYRDNICVLNCAIGFTCDRNICVHGIQLPTQIDKRNDRHEYRELIYAHLSDADGSRLTYTHFTSLVNYNSLVDISFNRPIHIQKNKLYKVSVDISKLGCYPMGTYSTTSQSEGVLFRFEHDHGVIRSIIFTISSSSSMSRAASFDSEPFMS